MSTPVGEGAPGAEEGQPPDGGGWSASGPGGLWLSWGSAQGLAAGPVPKHLWSSFPGKRHLSPE